MYMARKKFVHNQKLFPKQNVPHGVIVLAIIFRLGEEDVLTEDILQFWVKLVNMSDPYNNLIRHLFVLRKNGFIKTVRKKEGSYHSITDKGLKRLIYHYKKGNIPKWLLEHVEERYKRYDEYFRRIKKNKEKVREVLFGKRYRLF